MHFLLCLSYMVHHLSVTPHRPLNGSHTHLHMFFYYSGVPIISFVVTLWFLRPNRDADDGGANLDIRKTQKH